MCSALSGRLEHQLEPRFTRDPGSPPQVCVNDVVKHAAAYTRFRHEISWRRSL
jgi:hypothetical protein